ncbi:uroporphyrinogen-III synthase [Caldimonas tepidiphila]|uniref:uroporphyrinogen-III synthase n=1 Tax=Caldimonas tepidiphila TaxID=2315841 RepID=UPI000E5BAA9F|nr:uroporphyrinogen-III synthase [Caldimonas tepidiphila]
MTAGPRLLVTRPAAQAHGWVERLCAAGVDAVALPLIEISDAPDPAAVEAAWRALAGYRLAVFVSPNAAQRFFAARPPGLGWPAGTLAGSTGPGTTRALHDAGMQPPQWVAPPDDAPQFDSEALWALVRDWPWQGRRVLAVRGDGGRDWLAARLREAGAEVDFVAAYRRQAPRLDAAGRALLDAALAAPARHLWFFSSSEAIDNLLALCAAEPDRALPQWREARALASHPRIAERARRAGFGQVVEVTPSPAAVVAGIGRVLQSPAP